jgi:hypothetical protein
MASFSVPQGEYHFECPDDLGGALMRAFIDQPFLWFFTTDRMTILFSGVRTRHVFC